VKKWGLIVGKEATKNGGETVYRVITLREDAGGTIYLKHRIDEKTLVNNMSKGYVTIGNAKVEDGELKGTSGDLARFDSKVNKPMVIISEIQAEGIGLVGYKMATYEGDVTTNVLKEVLNYCEKVTKAKGTPIQNAQYVSETDTQRSFIRAYPNCDFPIEKLNRGKKARTEYVESESNSVKVDTTDKNKLEEIFSKDQLRELRVGRNNGVDITVYANRKLSAEQMAVIRKGLEEGLNARLWASPEYSVDAMRFYKADQGRKMDVTYYLNPKYDIQQLREISLGFTNGVDTSEYSDPKIPAREMAEIRLRLEMHVWKTHSVQMDESWLN